MIVSSDSDYLKQLAIIRKIRETLAVTDKINLPQICVIGDQSSGKSSFLSRLTGVAFPTACNMCTKAATVVTCTYDKYAEKPRYEIEDCDNPGTYIAIESSTAEAIATTQDKMLRAGDVRDNQIITDKSIKLRVTSPDVIDIIIVHLPGIQHHGVSKDSIDALIETNISKPETLNLVVSEAKQDAELTKALALAAKYDPTKKRTLQVLTKFDNFDTIESKSRAVKLIEDSLVGIQVASGQINLGPHAVISIEKDGWLLRDVEGDKTEANELVDNYGVSPSRAGVLTLKHRLQPMFASLIRTCLPELKKNVISGSKETQVLLKKIGAQPASPTEILNRCQITCCDRLRLWKRP